MGKIGDLFVRLGLKSEEFKKGMDEAGREVEGFGGKAGKMSKVAAAAWAAVAAAVVKFATDAVKMTQTWGDKWAHTMNGVQAAYGIFVRQLSSGQGWDNLFANMAEAFRRSKEISAVFDELFERNISLNYESAEAEKYISEQQLIMRDASRSDAERLEAADNIIAKTKELADLKKDIAKQEADANRENFKLQTKLNDEQIDFVLKNYNANRDIIKQAAEYNATMSALEKERKGGNSFGYLNLDQIANAKQKIDDLNKATTEEVKAIAQMIKQYDMGNDDLVNALANTEIALINVETQANKSMSRAVAMRGSLLETMRRQDEEAGIGAWVKPAWGDGISALAGVFGSATTSGGGILGGLDMQAQAAKGNAILAQFENMKVAAYSLADALSDSLVNSFDQLALAIAGVEDADMGSIAKSLIGNVADIAVKTGLMVMGTGEAIEALKGAFVNLFGGGAGAAIAAGAALVALGVAAKAGLAAIGNGGSAAGTSTTNASSSYGSGAAGQAAPMEIVVKVEGQLKGSDIVLASQRTQAAWAR